MRINKKLALKLGKPKENYNGEIKYVDVRYFPLALVLTVLAIIVSIIALTLVYDIEKWLLRKPSPPPKVITKVIREDALTAAQHEFIQQCEQNTTDINPHGEDNISHGIPDVHTSTWTCNFAGDR